MQFGLVGSEMCIRDRYRAPKANIPTTIDLNLKCIFENTKLKINKVPQNILLVNSKSVDNEIKQKNNITYVIRLIFCDLIFNI